MTADQIRCIGCDRPIQSRASQSRACPGCERGPWHKPCLDRHLPCGTRPDEAFENRHED